MSAASFPSIRTIEWKGRHVVVLDQKRLPEEEVYLELKSHQEVAEAIRRMNIRGAPAIGVATAMGIALGAQAYQKDGPLDFERWMERIFRIFIDTRPTAVNIRWVVDRMRSVIEGCCANRVEEIQDILVSEALRIYEEDIRTNLGIGEAGKELLDDGSSILTHCNAGALATAGYGTALGVIRSALREGKRIHVFACETRPFLQGARLTTWELSKDGIPVTLITDNMVGYLMAERKIDMVIVGADRIASNGDVANKIGTYGIAVLAREHDVPFYVAAPLSSFDFQIKDGSQIPIEHRDPSEVTWLGDRRIAAQGVRVCNPAFDITPNRLVTAIITERGILRPPYESSIAPLSKEATRGRTRPSV